MPQLIGGSKVRLKGMPTGWHVPCASQARTIVERELADQGRKGLMPKAKFGKDGVSGGMLG